MSMFSKKKSQKVSEKSLLKEKTIKPRDPGIAQIIKRPLFTEQSLRLSQDGFYSFEVHSPATKPEIKKEVEKIYNVHVEAVYTISLKKSLASWRGISGKKRVIKKAIVRVRKGETIDIGAHATS